MWAHQTVLEREKCGGKSHLISQYTNAQTSDLSLLTHSSSWPAHSSAQCNVDCQVRDFRDSDFTFKSMSISPHLHGRTKAKSENDHQMQRRGTMFAFGMGGPSEVWWDRKWCGTVGRVQLGTTRCNINERTHHLLLLIYQYGTKRDGWGRECRCSRSLFALDLGYWTRLSGMKFWLNGLRVCVHLEVASTVLVLVSLCQKQRLHACPYS